MNYKKFGNINFGYNMKRKYLEEPYEREGIDNGVNYYVWRNKTTSLHHRFIEITRNCEPSPEYDYIQYKWGTYLDKCKLITNSNGNWNIDFEHHTKHKLWNYYQLRKHQLLIRRGDISTKGSSPIILTTHPTGKFYGLIRSLIRYWEATYHLFTATEHATEDPPQ